MRISVNLATRPFVELRPLFARLRLAMLALTLLAIGLILGLQSLRDKAAAATAQMDALRRKTTAFEQERARDEARMHQPQNVSVLSRSQFLNALFAQKSFSWTAVMMDLENVLPTGVQVTSIDPVISAEGDVNIRLRVSGDRERAVELVRNLERSQRFLAPRLANETAQTQDTVKGPTTPQANLPGAVEFDILSGYNPLPAAAKRSEKDTAPHLKAVPRPAQPKLTPIQNGANKAAGAGGVR